MPLAFGMVEILPPPIHKEYRNILFLIGIKCLSFLRRNSVQAKKSQLFFPFIISFICSSGEILGSTKWGIFAALKSWKKEYLVEFYSLSQILCIAGLKWFQHAYVILQQSWPIESQLDCWFWLAVKVGSIFDNYIRFCPSIPTIFQLDNNQQFCPVILL